MLHRIAMYKSAGKLLSLKKKKWHYVMGIKVDLREIVGRGGGL